MTTTFDLHVKCEGLAFEGESLQTELARILQLTALRVLNGYSKGFVFDVNGNSVGQYALSITGDEEDDS